MNRKAFSFTLANVNFRRELRLALLAAMEACWVYSALVFIAALMQVPPLTSPLGLFGSYWIALVVGRELPRRKERWVLLQALAVLIAVAIVLIIVRSELYSQNDWLDFSWMPRYLRALFLAEGLGRGVYLTLAVLYVFIRGLGFGSRPLTLWFVSFQFRLGVVIFFALMLASAIYRPVDISTWVFAYFFVSLLAISLARLDEAGSDLHYGPRWAITLLAGVALVLFLGLGLLQVFTLDAASGLLRLFSPLWFLVQIVLLVVLIPASFVASFLVELLRPLFQSIDRFLQNIQRAIPQNSFEDIGKIIQSNPIFQFIAPLVQIAVALTVVLTIGYLLMRALNRRMHKVEEEMYEREALESEDEAARARRAFLPKKKTGRRGAGQIAGETIRRIYAAMVQTADEAGLSRRVAETPYEFSPRLQQTWKDQASDVDEITQAYVAVHYAEREVTSDEVSRVREAWERVQKMIHLKK